MKRKPSNPVKIGEIFGRLIVVEEAPMKGVSLGKRFNCKCICGTLHNVSGGSLRAGKVNSCGCLKKEQNAAIFRGESGMASWNGQYGVYKRHALNRGLQFDLTIEEFMEIASKNCEYCGDPPKKYNVYLNSDGSMRTKYKKSGMAFESAERATIDFNGVDRSVNTLGYSKGNAVPCCGDCNWRKGASTVKEFIDHIFRIAKFQFKKLFTIKESA